MREAVLGAERVAAQGAERVAAQGAERVAGGCEEGPEVVRGGAVAAALREGESRDLRDLRYSAYLIISSSDHSRHTSQRQSTSQSNPRHETQTVCRSADFLPILLGQEEHNRRPSVGASTDDSDEEGRTGGTGGINPGSSKEYSLITVKHIKGHEGGRQRTVN